MSDFFDRDGYKPVFSPVIRITKSKEKPTFISEIGNKENRNIFDRAMEVKQFMEKENLPLMKAAKILGYDGKSIAGKLRLLEFSEQERRVLTENDFCEEEALYFLQLDKSERLKAIEFCCNENLRSNQISEYITKLIEKTEFQKKKLFEVKDVGFVENSLKKAVALAKKMGFESSFESCDREEYRVFTVKVKKKK